MKTLSNAVLGLVAVSFMVLTVMCFSIQAEIVFDKVITITDKFTKQTHKEFISRSISNIDYFNIFYIGPDYISIAFDQTPKTWDWLKQSSRTIYILIDGNLIEKEYILRTDVWKTCVLESASITLTRLEALKISNAKLVEIKIGCCNETTLNNNIKNAIKEILK